MGLDLPAQDKLLVLRKSVQVKVSHFARCARFDCIKGALGKSEAAIMTATLKLVDRDEAMVDNEQLQLPSRKGGLGLQCLTASDGLTCHAGFLAAAALAQTAMEAGADSFQPFTGQSGLEMQQVWGQVSTACTCNAACKCADLEAPSLEEAFTAGQLPGLQHTVSQALADQRHEQLLAKYRDMQECPETREIAEQHLARLLSVQHAVATAWLNILPTKDQWEIDNDTVKSALRFLLGVSPGPPDQSHYRCVCGEKVCDSHHAMSCDKMSGFRTQRHNHVQNTVRYGCTAAGFDSCMEPKEKHLKGLRMGDKGYGMRGDILLSTLDDLINVDTTITHPANKTTRAAASKTAGAAAAAREKTKLRDHARDGTPGYSFVPFVIESYGRLGKEAEQLLGKLADGAASTGLFERQVYLQWIKKEISLTLIRGNARVFRRFVGGLTRGVGVNFQQGDDFPALDV